MVLEGMVPVLMHTPPTTALDSTTTTRFFILEAATAARCPDGPEPMTIKSYLTALMRVSLPGTSDQLWPRHMKAGPAKTTTGAYHRGQARGKRTMNELMRH